MWWSLDRCQPLSLAGGTIGAAPPPGPRAFRLFYRETRLDEQRRSGISFVFSWSAPDGVAPQLGPA